MTLPRKHHFLPEWYLSRWKKPFEDKDVIWEFSRVGPKRELKSRYRHPSATGYELDLYTIPDRPPDKASIIETEFLQIIDDRGAKAIRMAENNERAGPKDKAGLVQFMLSMLHRAPERIDHLEKRLAEDLLENPMFSEKDRPYFRSGALDVFVDLVQSELMIERMMQMPTFVITLGTDGFDLLTSDTPLMMSDGIGHKNAFVMLPSGPRTIVMLTDNPSIPERLAGHHAKALSRAMNEAVVVQAKKLVIGSDTKQKRFIDNRLNRANSHLARALDPELGIVKWEI